MPLLTSDVFMNLHICLVTFRDEETHTSREWVQFYPAFALSIHTFRNAIAKLGYTKNRHLLTPSTSVQVLLICL